MSIKDGKFYVDEGSDESEDHIGCDTSTPLGELFHACSETSLTTLWSMFPKERPSDRLRLHAAYEFTVIRYLRLVLGRRDE